MIEFLLKIIFLFAIIVFAIKYFFVWMNKVNNVNSQNENEKIEEIVEEKDFKEENTFSSNSTKRILIIAISVILIEIIFLIITTYILSNLVDLNSKFIEPHIDGIYSVFVIFIILILTILLIVVYFLYGSFKNKESNKIKKTSIILIAISILLSAHPIKGNLKLLKEEYEVSEKIKKIPFCFISLSCNLENAFPFIPELNPYYYENFNIVPNKIFYAFKYQNGDAIVVYNNKFGVVNKKGKFLIKPIYECIKDYRNGIALIYKGKLDDCFQSGQFCAIDTNNQIIINSENKNLKFLSDNIIMEFGKKQNETIKLYNNQGKIILNKKYIDCTKFNNGIALARFINKYSIYSSIIDTLGNNLYFCKNREFLYVFKSYIINKILQNYEVLENKNGVFSYLEKPRKREEIIQNFDFARSLNYDGASLEKDEKNAYENYFMLMKFYPDNENEIPFDSTKIFIKNDSLNFELTFYMKDNSLKYRKL